jgi:hypothetical protein
MPNRLLPAIACVLCWPALAQVPAGPSEAALADAVRLGTVATLAPLCGMRDEAWSFDLRRATVMDVTNAPQPDDESLRQIPGGDLAVAALSHAEAEALEAFAETSPTNTCGPLAHDPDLARADRVVQAFRLLKAGGKPAS